MTFPSKPEGDEFTNRKTPGHGGGKKIGHFFYFVESDGIRYPDESERMTNATPILPANRHQQWPWIFDYMLKNPSLWLVVPLVAVTVEGQRQELVSIRASIWRTARTRYNIHLTSRWWDGKLWVRTHPG